MKVKLSDHFTYKRLFKFTIFSIVMMIFNSIYSVVDGLFVSNFVGKTPFAAINLIFPFVFILVTLGFMLGTGGSAIVAKNLGEGNSKKANELFSLFIYVTIILGILMTLIGFIIIKPVAIALGATGQLLEDALIYGKILMFVVPFYMLQMEFQSFFVTAEKPQLGLIISIVSGVTNILLDVLFVAIFKFGLVGAALATGISQALGAIISLIYFFKDNTSLLRLSKTTLDLKSLAKACVNGSSELMSNVSMNLVCMLYNFQLIKYIGEDGVSAYGVLMYVCMIFLSVFIGYSIGVAPVVGFNYGAKNTIELKNVFKKSINIITVSSLLMVISSILLSSPLSYIFVGYDKTLFEITKRAFIIYSFSYLFSGIAIFASSFFTALNNGLISAIISFLRTLIFQVAAILLLPLWLNVDGIWLSVVVAEFMAFLVSIIFLLAKKKKYQY